MGAFPDGLVLTPNGRKLYCANNLDGTVSVVDTTTNTVTATIPVGSNPITAAITQNGQRVYVTNLNSNDVSVIDVSSDAVIATIAGAERPTTVAIQPKTKDDLTQDANNQ